MLSNITEKGFFEIYKNWVQYGYGSMLVYVEPPTEKPLGTRNICEYVMFREENSYKKVIINQDLLDMYNKGEN
jgi:hypothetical protein